VPADLRVSIVNADGDTVYPISTFTWIIAYTKQTDKAKAIAKRNEALRGQLSRVEPSAKHRVTLLGFTDQIDELMAAADVVVSKPGGLTTSEVLARGAAMAVVNPIPGQESRNSDFLLENGTAVKINNLSTLPYKLSALLNDPRRLARLRENARRLARPRAALDIARKALDGFGGSHADRRRKR
jgi:processive 1,2-diacylglycerol beta-glucosyltransferase